MMRDMPRANGWIGNFKMNGTLSSLTKLVEGLNAAEIFPDAGMLY